MVHILITCDECLCNEGHLGDTEAQAWALAKEDGWVRRRIKSAKGRAAGRVQHICWTCAGGAEAARLVHGAKRRGS